MVLVDTSVWVEVLRKSPGLALDKVVDFDDVVTCLPVMQEVLQGFRDERAFAIAHTAMRALPIVESPLREDVFLQAADLYRSARRAGFTIRSGVDCLIAACALRHGLEVLHHDRDFTNLARVSALRVRDVSQRTVAAQSSRRPGR
ncbi:MAG: PIN domain-containing protein [Acidobacteria bacterium]|nr:PIN domain-containing protein [Acidobacteriota bacterium]